MTSLNRVRNGLLVALGLCLVTPALHAVGGRLARDSRSGPAASSTGGVTTVTTVEKIDRASRGWTRTGTSTSPVEPSPPAKSCPQARSAC